MTTYDTSIGLGVVDGLAVLEKHASARYIWVDPEAADDTGTGLTSSSPKKLIASGRGLMRAATGDWLLLAGGKSFADTIADIRNIGGVSAEYPSVITTYDPADPDNVAKFGTLIATVNTDGAANAVIYSSGTAPHWIAFRAIKFDPATAGKFNIANPFNGLLIEKCRMRKTEILVQGSASVTGTKLIIRKSSIAYAYADDEGHWSGLYSSEWQGRTIEDCILYANGYTTRETDATIFNHNAYLDNENATTDIFRRNISAHASSHGIQQRAGGTCEYNVFVKNPINCLYGGGDDYDDHQPNGVTGTFTYNVAIGSQDINSSTPRGYGFWFKNTNPALDVRFNLLMKVSDDPTDGLSPWVAEADFDQPTLVSRRHNIVYDWDRANEAAGHGSFPGQVITSDANSILDIAAAGSNQDSATYSFVDTTRTVGTYYQSIGGTNSETDFLEAAIDNPDDPDYGAVALGDYLRAGFPFPAEWADSSPGLVERRGAMSLTRFKSFLRM